MFLDSINPDPEEGIMDLITASKALAKKAREDGRELVVVTNSGSIYRLFPQMGDSWMILRSGIEGRESIDFGRVQMRTDGEDPFEMRIGPWTTTGLKSVELVNH